jgi:AcrR family transcriptional regulator
MEISETAQTSGTAIPKSIAAAWGVRDQPRKGPKPALTLGRIVEAAIRVADADGLDAVSMGRVAAEAGTAPMSLYRHVASKDELIDLMVDAALGRMPGQAPADEDWRAGLARCAWHMRRAAQRHPWVMRVPLRSLPIMPNQVAWFDSALACLRGTGLSEARKASVILLLSGYVRNLATTEADMMTAVRSSGQTPSEWMGRYAAMLKTLADPARYPALGMFMDSQVFETADDPDDEFIFGLDRILDGIEALIGGEGTAATRLRFARDAAEDGHEVAGVGDRCNVRAPVPDVGQARIDEAEIAEEPSDLVRSPRRAGHQAAPGRAQIAGGLGFRRVAVGRLDFDVGKDKVAGGRHGLAQQCDRAKRVILVRNEVQDRDDQDRDRLGEVDQLPNLRRLEDLCWAAHVAADRGRARGRQQCLSVAHHDRVDVHVYDMGAGPGHLVHVLHRGQAGADVEKLRYASVRAKSHRPAKEGAVLPGQPRQLRDGPRG